MCEREGDRQLKRKGQRDRKSERETNRGKEMKRRRQGGREKCSEINQLKVQKGRSKEIKREGEIKRREIEVQNDK